MSWHGMHFLKELSPASTSWASVTPVDAVRITAAITNCLMSISSVSPAGAHAKHLINSAHVHFGELDHPHRDRRSPGHRERSRRPVARAKTDRMAPRAQATTGSTDRSVPGGPATEPHRTHEGRF